jgi:hypothetical protein
VGYRSFNCTAPDFQAFTCLHPWSTRGWGEVPVVYDSVSEDPSDWYKMPDFQLDNMFMRFYVPPEVAACSYVTLVIRNTNGAARMLVQTIWNIAPVTIGTMWAGTGRNVVVCPEHLQIMDPQQRNGTFAGTFWMQMFFIDMGNSALMQAVVKRTSSDHCFTASISTTTAICLAFHLRSTNLKPRAQHSRPIACARLQQILATLVIRQYGASWTVRRLAIRRTLRCPFLLHRGVTSRLCFAGLARSGSGFGLKAKQAPLGPLFGSGPMTPTQ